MNHAEIGDGLNEKRLIELEEWALTERSELTDSENVLLDAIEEACVAVRRAWQYQDANRAAVEAWREKANALKDEIRKDREAMEGADLELAVGDADAAEKARTILGARLAEHPEDLD